jgi:hypothetical protein
MRNAALLLCLLSGWRRRKRHDARGRKMETARGEGDGEMPRHSRALALTSTSHLSCVSTGRGASSLPPAPTPHGRTRTQTRVAARHTRRPKPPFLRRPAESVGAPARAPLNHQVEGWGNIKKTATHMPPTTLPVDPPTAAAALGDAQALEALAASIQAAARDRDRAQVNEKKKSQLSRAPCSSSQPVGFTRVPNTHKNRPPSSPFPPWPPRWRRPPVLLHLPACHT